MIWGSEKTKNRQLCPKINVTVNLLQTQTKVHLKVNLLDSINLTSVIRFNVPTSTIHILMILCSLQLTGFNYHNGIWNQVSFNVSIWFHTLISWYSFNFENLTLLSTMMLTCFWKLINLSKIMCKVLTKVAFHFKYFRKWKKLDFKTEQFTFSGNVFLDRILRIRFIRRCFSLSKISIFYYDNGFLVIAQIKV